MKSFPNESPLTTDGQGAVSVGSGTTDAATTKEMAVASRRAIALTSRWLLDKQHPQGYWQAELEGDTILESEAILLWAFLEREDSDLARRAADYLVEKQLPTGGWALYPGGDVEISASVKAYFALKLTGHDPSAEYMGRARRAILAHGGADSVNSFTRFYLALLGQIPHDQCPAVPPEMVLVPKWLPVNLYAMSAWSRTIMVPLSIVSAFQPVRTICPSRGILELFIRHPRDWPPLRCPGLPGRTGILSWDRFFRVMDGALKWCQRHRLLPLRHRAVKAAERWMLDRYPSSDGLGAIFPPIIWSLVALRCLGYDDRSAEVIYCHQQLEALALKDENTGSVRLQPCKSPVWDTAITLRALSSSGIGPDHPAVARATEWLVRQQIHRAGDWALKVKVEPGGWCFEHHNDFYPDVDDTAMALMALASQFSEGCSPGAGPPGELQLVSGDRARRPEQRIVEIDRSAAAIERGLNWLLAMQNDDGGWGAFDRNNNRRFLCYVPFADHNAMIDPSAPDLSGRVLETLGKLSLRVGHPSIDRAVAYLRQAQLPDGSWFGRWGVNYIYGTWQAVSGLVSVGVPPDDPSVVAGAHWLLAYQHPCGGWGESPHSYCDPTLRGQGSPTASQTAWALMGLLAAGFVEHPALARGIRFLIDRQREDGTWDEREFTGTGFPRVFYLRYHYYPIYFPLLAISRWRAAASAPDPDARPPLRLVVPDDNVNRLGGHDVVAATES
jgi:squalene-hopene/tetraprenyl-beta-curcumene cyclase